MGAAACGSVTAASGPSRLEGSACSRCSKVSAANSTQNLRESSMDSMLLEEQGRPYSPQSSIYKCHREYQFAGKGLEKKAKLAPAEQARMQEQLLRAARCGSFKQLVDLVNAGAEVQSTTLRGQTALMLSAASHTENTIKVLQFLIETMADVNARDELGWTALHYACRNSQTKSAELLIEHKAAVDATAADGKTAAMLAAVDGCDSLVMDLLGHKAFVDEADEHGWTLLTYACEEGHVGLVKFLLKSRANPCATAKEKSTPLMVAAKHGDKKLGELLVKRRAVPNARNSSGDTALLLSIKAHKESFAIWLIDIGADVMVKNSEDEDAYALACSPDFSVVKGMLESKLRAAQKEGMSQTNYGRMDY